MPSVQDENLHRHEQVTKSYSVVDLSNRGITRIDCLPRGVSPVTLLLNNNDISRLENLQYFTHLQQLSLANNHVVDMKGVGAALNLRVLDLSNNSIVAIEGISPLQNLEWLNLSGNSIEEIRNIDNNVNLNHLDLSDNSVATLSGLRTLRKLKTLLLHGNLISSLTTIKDQLSATVRTLSLADNEISDLNEMAYLSSMVNLEQLTVLNNPCVMPSSSWRLEVNFRPYLVYCCTRLTNLDGRKVSHQERIFADLLDQAFYEIGHPSLGQHIQLVSILYHITVGHQQTSVTSASVAQETTQRVIDDGDGENLLESESFYLPVPSPDATVTTEPEDPVMTDEEAYRLLSLAATIIQAHVRGFLVRRKFDFCKHRQRNHAAAVIQAAWRGYRARTLDIKVVNIRNEIRVRRLLSFINHLYAMFEREHKNAVTNRVQLIKAMKYLWQQISQQKQANRFKLRKKQEKAAIKLQAWWRGYAVRKAYPQISQIQRRDKMQTLFILCLSLQKQLHAVTSQIKEIQKDMTRESSLREDLSGSDRQEEYYDTTAQLNTTEDDTKPWPDSEVDLAGTRLAATPESGRLEAEGNAAPSAKLPQDNIAVFSSKSQIDIQEGNIASTQSLHKGEPVLSNAVMKEPLGLEPLDPVKENIASSHAEPVDPQHGDMMPTEAKPVVNRQENMAPSYTDPLNAEVADEPPTNAEPLYAFDDSVGTSRVNEEGPSEPTVAPPGGQISDTPTLQSSLEVQTGGPSSDDPQQHIIIPKVVVSCPAPPTDHESSDKDSENTNEATSGNGSEQVAQLAESVLDHSKNENAGDNLPKAIKTESQVSRSSVVQSIAVASQANRRGSCSKENQTEQSVFLTVYGLSKSTSQSGIGSSEKDEESFEVNPAEESNVDSAKRTLPNLGERATSLLSQLRSEIASMKSARLNSVSLDNDPETVSKNTGTRESPEGRMDRVESIQPESSLTLAQCKDLPDAAKHGPCQSGPLSSVTYRLPLFEDVAMSFSLDDILLDADGEGAQREPFTAVTVTTQGKASGTADEEKDSGQSEDSDGSFDTKL